MTDASITLIITWILIAILLVFQPWITHHNLQFGVAFKENPIKKEPYIKAFRNRYFVLMLGGAVLIGFFLILWLFMENFRMKEMIVPYTGGIVALVFYGSTLFAIFHAKTMKMQIGNGSKNRISKMERHHFYDKTICSHSSNLLSSKWMLALVPVPLATYGVAILGYSYMAHFLPTHYSFIRVDSWTAKSWWIALLPAIVETVIAVVIGIAYLFMRKMPVFVDERKGTSTRAYRFHRYMLLLFLIFGVLIEIIFLMITVGFLRPIHPLWFAWPVLLSFVDILFVFLLYIQLIRIEKSKGSLSKHTSTWIWGVFYYNPLDPAVFVEKQTRIGYTINFARPGGWIFLIGVIGFVIATVLFSAG